MKKYSPVRKCSAVVLALMLFASLCGCGPSLDKAIEKADALVDKWNSSAGFYSYYGSYEEYSDANAYMLSITLEPFDTASLIAGSKMIDSDAAEKNEALQKYFRKFDNVQVIIFTVDEDGDLLDAYVDGEWTAVG